MTDGARRGAPPSGGVPDPPIPVREDIIRQCAGAALACRHVAECVCDVKLHRPYALADKLDEVGRTVGLCARALTATREDLLRHTSQRWLVSIRDGLVKFGITAEQCIENRAALFLIWGTQRYPSKIYDALYGFLTALDLIFSEYAMALFQERGK